MNPYVAQWALRFGWFKVLYHQPKWLPTSLEGFAETEETMFIDREVNTISTATQTKRTARSSGVILVETKGMGGES